MFFEKHKTIIIIAIITAVVIIAAGLSTINTGSAFAVNNIVGSITQPVQKGVSYVMEGVGGFFNFISEMHSYKSENDRLTAELAEMTKQYRSAEDYRLENERLSALLDLKVNGIGNFPSTGAKVIAWSASNWYDFYTIDKGTANGIKKKDMVVTEAGLVGYIDDVGLNWARVMTVINASSSVGVRVVRTGDLGMLDGDFELEKNGICKMNFFNKDAQIAIGDIVETSGLGGIYAAGISIGKVIEIQTDATGTSQTVMVEPLVDFNNMHTVLVISGDSLR